MTREASEKTLLPEGTPVAAGMFDVNACGIASGLSDEEQMCMIAGTWSINCLLYTSSIKENVSLQNFDKLSSASFIQKIKEKKMASEYTEKMSTKMNGIDDLVSSLSGGNQQKVVLAKCLLSDPKVLIMDEPTRGIDVGAKAAIYKICLLYT